jgi:hypothetical protein
VEVKSQVIKNLLKNKIMITVRASREVVEGERNELAADVEVVAENFSGSETVTGMVLKKQFNLLKTEVTCKLRESSDPRHGEQCHQESGTSPATPKSEAPSSPSPKPPCTDQGRYQTRHG